MADFIINDDGTINIFDKKKKKESDKWDIRNATLAGQTKNNSWQQGVGEKEWYEQILQKPQAFEDGYQFGDVTKTVFGTAGDILSTGAKATWQNIYDIGMNVAGANYWALDKIGILPGAYDAFTDIERYKQDVAVVSDINKGVDKLNQATRNNSVLGDFSKNTLQSAVQSAEMAGLSKFSKLPLWQVNSLATGFRNEYVNALNNGATKEQATISGLTSGISEVLTEYLFSGFIKLPGTGSGLDTALGKATEKIGNQFLRTAAQYGINIGGEAFEEVLSGFGSALGQKLTYLKDTDFKDIYSLEDALENAGAGALSALFGSANPQTIQNIRDGRNLVTGLTSTQQKYIDEIAQQRMVEAQKRNEKLGLIQKGKINQRTMTDFEKGRLADTNKLQQVNLPGLSNKDMDLQQSAYKYGINPNSEFVVTTKTMLDNRGIKSRFDADAFKNINGNAYWTNNNGVREVIFNPNASEQAILEEIAIHELTHDLMSSENSKDVIDNQKIMDYVSTLDGYKEAREAVIEKYASQIKDLEGDDKTAYIDEEIVAETLGKNIGSQEYIRRLIDDEPSIAKNIYDWVVNKVANKNGVKNEKAYWNNVKNNFEKAYNMSYNNGNQADTRLSKGNYGTALMNKYYNALSKEQWSRVLEDIEYKDFPLSNDYARGKRYDNKIVFAKIKHNKPQVVSVLETNEIAIKAYEMETEELYNFIDNVLREGGFDEAKIGRITERIGKKGLFRRYNSRLHTFTNDSKRQVGSNRAINSNDEKVINRKRATTTNEQNRNDRELDDSSFFNGETRYSLSETGKTGTLEDIMPDSELVKNSIDVTNYKTNYENVPDNLLGFRKNGQNKGYFEEKYKYNLDLLISVDGGKTYFEDSIKGLNYNQAIERAKRNWGEDAILKVKPSSNKDIRYSLSDTGKTGTLMAIHNLYEDKLKGVLELGGFPVPSIAIMKGEDAGNHRFGDISVLFDKETIDPSNKKNEVYNSDIYSTRFPSVENKINTDVIENLVKEGYKYGISMSESNLEYLVENNRFNIDNVPDELMELYFKQNGIEYTNDNRDAYENGSKRNEYINWLDSLNNSMIGEKRVIRPDVDLFTPSGNRRSLEQRSYPYNLENIIKIMTKKATKGSEGNAFVGVGEIRGNASKKFKSIKDIKNSESKLVSSDEMLKIKDEINANYDRLTSELANYYTHDNRWQGMENVAYALNETAKSKVITKQVLENQLAEDFIENVPDDLLNETVDFINSLKDAPTEYFEAKPQRAIGFDEVQAIIIPNTTTRELKQQLQDAGLKYYEYDPNIEGDKQRVINQFEDLKFSQQNKEWQSFLDDNFESKGTKTRLGDIKLPGITNTVQEEVQTEVQKSLLPIANELKELNKNLNKVLNPNEISQLTPQDASTTPNLPGINRNKVGDGKSKFFDNIKNKTNMLNDEQKTAILSNDDVKYYDKVTNKDSLEEAYARLQENGTNEVLRWLNNENITSTDVAEGWILLKQYGDSGNAEGMVEVAKKMRQMGSVGGQVIQAFNILSRLTPEGMVKYAQSELLEAYDQMVKNKSAKWIEENRDKFELKPNEVQFIMDTMQEVSTMEDGYDKRFKLAQIQKLMTDKLPPSKGAGIKAWMRISMLFNPKTQVRNVAGNALIAPINAFGDMFASGVDKLISAKTGVRTTGNTNWKNYAQGMKTGLYQSYNDFKNGVNTRNIEGNRFEVTEGKSFNDNNPIGKALNKVDSLLSFMLDAGDRGFYEASFVNSINNQMVLNNTTEVTQEMIDIATQEALSRTWQDNNEYTKFVMNIRNGLNKMTIGGYGLGDILIPFAKTPANLTKAIVEYSPAGLIGTINKGIKLNRSLTNGQYSAKTQHEFVQSLGKATAGTMLYILGIALANAGITTGESDEDKDVSNFMKNTLGVNSYSIKIGDMSFTYDWAQPLAAPLAITANLVQKQKEEASLLENVVSTLDTAGNLLLEQSFMESISTVLNNNEGIATGMQEAILDLPARAIPTFLKQITDLTDGTQRQTFVKDKPIESMFNSIKAKIPGLSYTLDPSVDTLGRDIQKYGGKNNLFNVFLNPANVSTENVSESAQEIYRLYKETGETNIMPRVAPYYVNKKGEKIILTTQQRTQYQKVSGAIIEENVAKLLGSTAYQNMSDTKKAETINDIVNYSYNIAQMETLGTELSETYETAYEYAQIGDISDFYEFRNSIDDTDADTKRTSIVNYLYNSDLEDNQIANLYGNYYSSDKTLNAMLELRIPMREFIKFNSADIQGQYNTNTGQTISGSKKNATIEFVNTLNLSKAQRAILVKSVYSSHKSNDNDIIRYVNTLPGSANEKKVLLKSIGFDNYDEDVFNYINSQNISKEEKIMKLKELGFTVRDGRVYY